MIFFQLERTFPFSYVEIKIDLKIEKKKPIILVPIKKIKWSKIILSCTLFCGQVNVHIIIGYRIVCHSLHLLTFYLIISIFIPLYYIAVLQQKYKKGRNVDWTGIVYWLIWWTWTGSYFGIYKYMHLYINICIYIYK